jgi:4-amino-4-deoxy-L-arabinose transferase-like glycosyltransferase
MWGFLIMRSAWASKYWAEILLLGIIGLSGFLNLWNLWNLGFSNPYYAAAVRSMLSNPGIAFFNSFDAVGFVTVDKPPIGIWVQAASAAVFGFSNLSVTLPQALAGIGSVALIYFILRRPFGKPAGLLAAFVLATTPVFVIISRNGTMDAQLVFVVLLALLVALKAAREQSLWLLLLSVVLVGIGFNIKMIQAFVVVPAIIAIYLFGTTLPTREKIAHLAIALLVLAAVSLSWAIAVDAVPTDQRPYIGSSGDNSVIGLMLGHNGEEAFVSEAEGAFTGSMLPPGPFRLFDQGIDNYLSWLLPFALIGLLVWWRRPAALSSDGLRNAGFFSEKGITLLALCLWLLPGLLYFSFTPGYWASYYLATIAPPLAGLVGIGAAAMFQEYRGDRPVGWVLVAAVFVTGLVQVWTLSKIFIYDPLGYGSLEAIVLVGSLIGTGMLVWLRLKKVQAAGRCSVSVACIAVAALLVAPAAWSCVPAIMVPSTAADSTAGFVAFLRSHDTNTAYLAAVPFNGYMVGSMILDTGRPVMALGGFSGMDQILSVTKMPELIHNRTVQYVLVPSGTSPPSTNLTESVSGNDAIFSWVADHCTQVPASAWNGNNDPLLRQYALYDCSGAA